MVTVRYHLYNEIGFWLRLFVSYIGCHGCCLCQRKCCVGPCFLHFFELPGKLLLKKFNKFNSYGFKNHLFDSQFRKAILPDWLEEKIRSAFKPPTTDVSHNDQQVALNTLQTRVFIKASKTNPQVAEVILENIPPIINFK